MGDYILFSGTGTCQIREDRAASSVLIEVQGTRFVYDMGRRVSENLFSAGFKSDDIEHLVFSHHHPDHISDLIAFLQGGAWSREDLRKKNVNIYAYPETLDCVKRLMETFPLEYYCNPQTPYEINYHSITSSEFQVENLEISSFPIPHGELSSCGIKFEAGGQLVAITGDGSFSDEMTEFLTDADIAIFDSGHMTQDSIISLAVRTQAKRLICTHVYDNSMKVEPLQEEAVKQGYEGQIELAEDFMKIDLQ